MLDGLHVHTRTSGQQTAGSDPVVLVHGFGVSSRYFVPTLACLGAEGFDTRAPDLPGHGLSDTPAQAFNLDEHSAFLLQWLRAEGLPSVSLVANSMGCPIAVRAAVRDPARIRRLVLIGSTLDPAARSVVPVLLRFVRGIPYERVSLAAVLLRDYGRMGLRLWPEFKSLLADRIETHLPHVRQPVLLVRGVHDPIAPRSWLEIMSGHLGGPNRIAEVPAVGHAVNYSAAESLTALMTPFLRGTAVAAVTPPACAT